MISHADAVHYLDSKGMKHSNKGFQYLITAIEHVSLHPEAINKITRYLYPTIADKHHTKPMRVERAMRHEIEIVYPQKKPTVSEFIAKAVDDIKYPA